MITQEQVLRIVFGVLPSILMPVVLVPMCLSPVMWEASPFGAVLMTVTVTFMGLCMLYSALFEV